MANGHRENIMKVRELIIELQKVNPELDVVLNVDISELCPEYDSVNYRLKYISMGWEPSGVISLESDEITGY